MDSKFLLFLVFAISIGTITATRCIRCSSKDNLNCLSNPNAVVSTPCDTNITEGNCFMRIYDGFTERGCTMDLSEKQIKECTGDNCAFCNDEILGADGITIPCNTLKFPTNRIECHECTGPQAICGIASVSNAFICAKHTSDNKCYIRRQGDTITRGCTSDFPDCLRPGACYSCDVNGCNNMEVNSYNVPEYKNSSITITNNFIFIALLTIIIKVIS